MSELFNEVKKRHFKMLRQYVPIVARVHGQHHPEFLDVRRQFDIICEKIEKAGTARTILDDEFEQLRSITGNYTVPDDVCESYEAVYKMLRDLDEAYRA